LFTTHKEKVFPADTSAADLLWAWKIGQAVESAITSYRTQADEQAQRILRRGARFFATAICGELIRSRNGDDVFASVDVARLSDMAMVERFSKYATMAVLLYVTVMRGLLDAGLELSVLLRTRETSDLLRQRVADRLREEELAPKALEEKLPTLPKARKT
jgi:hypothetical protein